MSIESRLDECEIILTDLGLPESVCKRKVAKLTFLALCNIKPDSEWLYATKKSMTLSKDIMNFVNEYYEERYATNSRESFRKLALKIFLDQNIIQLNPDDSSLKPSSSNTHYAITDLVLDTVKQFNTKSWSQAVGNFKYKQFPENEKNNFLINGLKINNFKSIIDADIELGLINVFIGENGCGKSNILEAVALISASKSDDLNFDGLYSKGVRIARPDLMVSSFLEKKQKDSIDLFISLKINETNIEYKIELEPSDPNDIYTKWVDKSQSNSLNTKLSKIIGDYISNDIDFQKGFEEFNVLIDKLKMNPDAFKSTDSELINKILSEYGIFDLNTKSLRGIVPVDSRKTPLGLNGEGLDLLISSLNSFEKAELLSCVDLFSWLEDIKSDKNEKYKMDGLKPGRSLSTLYFSDRFMQKQNNILSAENSNEGILHVLFYLTLFISNKTPNFFAIDNIETALNPKLCQKLIKILVILAKKRGKQVLITTHNPAILDGLNLTDDDQRLFEVYRTSEGSTRIRRIKFKSDLSDKNLKLSEMWMNGALGAVPTNF
ncbi:AAA family ATPase [Sphingobacterium sp. SGL-16]|uniref:AAA family ATPase n=1 Tax=Sphingobacterium sp. SGL-16 TaxID=2710883 RepID=UPI0013ED2DFD|nr:AAA family ATPase [Sphingobacterium sp. SGL-16]NGM72837.1 AAA family ATPase [Sphingobacterium sp. SGL-16]